MHQVAGTPLGLRKFELRDIDDLWQFRNDTSVTSGLGGFSTGYSHEDLREWIEFHRSRSDEVLYAIVDLEEDNCIGHGGLYQVDHRSQKGEFAILLGADKYRGKGFGASLTRFMLDLGFRQLNLNKISLSALKTNERAIGLYERLGFIFEGFSRQDEWRNGEFVDVVNMSILRSEWKQLTE